MKKNILILVSDPDSINYEIIEKSMFFFNKRKKNNYIFIGSKKKIKKNIKNFKSDIQIIDIAANQSTKIYLKHCFNKAFELIKQKKCHALINLPLNKKFLPKNYNGFTEYISDYFNKKNKTTMLLYSENFSVCPNTTHIPIKKIHKHLNKNNIINNIKNINNFYKKIIGKKKPTLALLGFNPHNGIDFKNSTEEKKIIIPAINNLKKKIKIIGPLSPDSAFNKIEEKKINCLIGNYHDQVLPLFKYINKFKGINITLGLPFLRISPDHGTGKDIKNKNMASPESFLCALNFFEKNFKKI